MTSSPGLRQELSTIGFLLMSSFCFGFHISSLNAPRSALTCRPHSDPTLPSDRHLSLSLPPCLSLTSSQFGLITAGSTLGGLLLLPFLPSLLPHFRSTRSVLASCAALAAVGSLIQAGSTGVGSMLLGRFLSGAGAAGGIAEVPSALMRVVVAREGKGWAGSIGVMHQLAICTGILSSLLLGLFLSQPTTWRLILVFGFLHSLLQLSLAPFILDPTAFPTPHDDAMPTVSSEEDPLLDAGGDPSAVAVRKNIEQQQQQHEEEQSQHQAYDDERLSSRSHQPQPGSMSVGEMLGKRSLRRGVWITLFAMLLQQLSGINALMYYSTSILSPLMPTVAPLISLLIALFSLLSTFPALILLPKLGRKPLLLLSIAGIALSTLAVGYGLNHSRPILAAVGVFGFVGAFGTGLGPVPFMLTSELVPTSAQSSLSSLALVTNFSANLLIGALFLPLQEALSGRRRPSTGTGDAGRGVPSRVGQGNVFYVFTTCLVVGFVVMWKGMKVGSTGPGSGLRRG